MYAKSPISELNIPGLKRATGHDNCYDARLRNFATGDRTILDVQPYVEYGCPDTNVYTCDYTAKPRIYNNYNDIDLGLVIYQTDETSFDPYFGPTLNLNGKSNCTYFKKPDEAMWRVSTRTPKYCAYNYLKCNSKSFIDTLEHREDIISQYGSQINRNRFMVI